MPGDFSKAFGAGADFVMAGGMFSGHDESGGQLKIMNGKKFKEFYGMSSQVAMEKYSGSVANYRASEGKYVLVPYRGPVEETLKQILGGVRSTCTYVGAGKLKELSKRTTFIRVSEHHNVVFGDEKENNEPMHNVNNPFPSSNEQSTNNNNQSTTNNNQSIINNQQFTNNESMQEQNVQLDSKTDT